ncbi:MAG: protein-methionine-sulfoxide reductase heme-binding subunit MsrQ [Methylococcales bacterium]
MNIDNKHWAIIKVIVFILGALPFLSLVYAAGTHGLGANPIEALHFGFGDWALRFLCIGLALTPYKTLTGQSWPTRFRRMIGLFTFFYAAMHFLVFIVLDLSLSWQQFIEEVPKSPYILMGLLTFILLIPLAATSTKLMQKRLGRSWFKVHRLVYLAAFTALLHYFWLVKLDYTQPLIYALVIAALLAVRLPKYYSKSNFANHLKREG